LPEAPERGDDRRAIQDFEPWRAKDVFGRMPKGRILYFRGGILEQAEDFASDDLVDAACRASSRHPDLTAEVWWGEQKAAVVRPCWDRRMSGRRSAVQVGQSKRMDK
jgi:hypothetical protein